MWAESLGARPPAVLIAGGRAPLPRREKRCSAGRWGRFYRWSIDNPAALCHNGTRGEATMEELDREQFGAFLAQLRREKGLTQKELAEQLFVTDKAVSKWERGVSHS